MKTVFSDINNIAHMWANKTPDEAKTPSRNFYFNGNTIYSYGSHFPIATHHPTDSNIVFFTTRGYSVTTTKHIYTVRRAINHKTLIYCNNPHGNKPYNDVFWKNIDTFYQNAINFLKDAEKPRIRKETVVKKRVEASNELANIEIFLSAFDITIDTLKNKQHHTESGKAYLPHAFKELVNAVKNRNNDQGELLAMYNKNAEKSAKIKEKKEAFLKAERLVKANKRLKDWLKGKQVDTYHLRELPQIYLRSIPLKGATEIETSWGATVSLKEGKILYKVFKTAPNKLLGKTIGGYTIVNVMNNFLRENTGKLESSITIGCHVIYFSEIERFAKKMKW